MEKEEKMFVVIEDKGFCTTKSEKDIKDSDIILHEVEDFKEGSEIIHGYK